MKKSFWLQLFTLISILILFIGISFSYNTLQTFYRYKEKIDQNTTLSLERFLYLYKYTLKKEWNKLTSPKPQSDEKSQLKTFRITLKNKDINKLNANLPQSGKDHYIKGYLKVSDEKKPYKIKLRYRGDSFLHWYYPQKSLRIKLLKNKVYDKARVFNLINPPHDFSIIDCVAYEISKKEGLISPKYEPVRVFINGKFMGVYIYLSQVDESLLRSYKRMPGSIYYGDMSSTPDTDMTKPARLFFDETLWLKKASRNFEQKQNREDIQLFIEHIKNDKNFLEFAQNYLNLDRYYTFLGLDTLFGGFHHDYAHNHKLYFDPYIGKFEPIQWDLRYWSASDKKDNSLYPLELLFAKTPYLEAQRDKKAYQLLQKYPTKKIIKMLRYYQNLILPDLKADLFRDTAKRPKEFPKGIATFFTIDEFKNSIKRYENIITQREQKLYSIYKDTKLSYKLSNNKLYIKVDGNSPILLHTKDKDIVLYPSRKKQKLSSSLFPYLYGYYRYVPAPAYYELNQTDIKKLSFSNYITQDKVIPKKDNFKVKKLSLGYIKKTHQTVVLEGNITVKKDLIYDRYTDVVIKPDTIFLLYPKVSIFFYSKVEANATKHHPIKFIAKDPQKPFGSVVVQGKSASKSFFNYCIFENGSTTTKNLIHYTAQFNLHDLSSFTVQNTFIGKNFVGDDSMHIAYSKGSVKNCTFIGARSDALDIDISDIAVENCFFKDAGNDSLDIMTTKLLATNNTFINSGDKGISVGEASLATIQNSLFEKNYIGLEIKDNSKVYATKLTFKNSKYLDIHLYRKNKRYKWGGSLKAKDINFSKKLLKYDRYSKVNIDE